MKKWLLFLIACSLSLVLAAAASAQSKTTTTQTLTRDLSAFAEGSLTDGGVINLSLDDMLPPNVNNIPPTLSVFIADPSTSTFAFSTQTLSASEFSFESGTLSTAHVATTLTGGLAGLPINITWTAVSQLLRDDEDRRINDQNAGTVFHIGLHARTRFATISGTANSTTCCSFSNGSIMKNVTKTVDIIQP